MAGRNTSEHRSPRWTGGAGEWAIVVSRGEPARTDAQVAEIVRQQVRDYLRTWASAVADLVDVDAVAEWAVHDHVRPGAGVVLSREHLLRYAGAVLAGKRP